jgi:two-component system, response regulator
MTYILLIEDNADDEYLTQRALLKTFKGRVEVLRDGEAAAHFINRTGPYADRSPDDIPLLILSDLQLPRQDGAQITRLLCADPYLGTTPVVIFTTSDLPADIQRCYAAGANSYVRKPASAADFERAITQIHRYWLDLNLTVER